MMKENSCTGFRLPFYKILMIRQVIRFLPYQYQPTNALYSFIYHLRCVILIIDNEVERPLQEEYGKVQRPHISWEWSVAKCLEFTDIVNKIKNYKFGTICSGNAAAQSNSLTSLSQIADP